MKKPASNGQRDKTKASHGKPCYGLASNGQRSGHKDRKNLMKNNV